MKPNKISITKKGRSRPLLDEAKVIVNSIDPYLCLMWNVIIVNIIFIETRIFSIQKMSEFTRNFTRSVLVLRLS